MEQAGWSKWHKIVDKNTMYDEVNYTGAAVYILGAKSGSSNSMVELYCGHAENLAKRWSQYAKDGSHLKEFINDKYFSAGNTLRGKFKRMKDKPTAKAFESQMLRENKFMWNTMENLHFQTPSRTYRTALTSNLVGGRWESMGLHIYPAHIVLCFDYRFSCCYPC